MSVGSIGNSLCNKFAMILKKFLRETWVTFLMFFIQVKVEVMDEYFAIRVDKETVFMRSPHVLGVKADMPLGQGYRCLIKNDSGLDSTLRLKFIGLQMGLSKQGMIVDINASKG